MLTSSGLLQAIIPDCPSEISCRPDARKKRRIFHRDRALTSGMSCDIARGKGGRRLAAGQALGRKMRVPWARRPVELERRSDEKSGLAGMRSSSLPGAFELRSRAQQRRKNRRYGGEKDGVLDGGWGG